MATRKKKSMTGVEREALAKAAAAIRVANKAAETAKKVLAAQSQSPKTLTQEQIEELIQKTVVQTLTGIGIHVRTDEEIDELRKDFAYTRAWRQTISKTTRTGWLTFVTVAVTGFIGFMYVAARIWLLGHP